MAVSILVKHFFKNHPVTPDFYQKWKASGNWGPHLLPIYQWDDVLYVAGTSLPEGFPNIEQKVVFVMCEELILKEVWNSLQQESLSSTTDHSDIVQSLELVETEDKNKEDSGEISEESNPEIPGGLLDLNLTVPPPSLTMTSLENSPLTLTPNLDSILQKPVVEEVALNLQFPPEPPAPEIKQATISEFQKNDLQKNSPAFSVDLSELEKHFSDWILFTKEEGFLRPLTSSQTLSLKLETLKDFRLNTNDPSPWRIVDRSKKSFHGKPANSEVLQFFVQAWDSNMESLNHLTICPVIMAAEVIGFLTCFKPTTDFSSNTNQLNALSDAEKSAGIIYQSLNNLSQSAA